MPRGISKTPAKTLKKQKANGGRPTKMTPETIKKLEEVFGIGGSDGEACFYADISTVTLYEYIKLNPEFHNRKEALKERPILKARQELIKGLQNNPELALKYLERKRKKEFSLKLETELTGKDGGAVQVEHSVKHDLTKLSTEEKLTMRELLEKTQNSDN